MKFLDSFGFLDEFRRMNARQVIAVILFVAVLLKAYGPDEMSDCITSFDTDRHVLRSLSLIHI